MTTTSHIYLIQDGKDIGTNVFKIGKTKQGIDNIIKLKRFHGYSQGTIQHNTWLVSCTMLDEVERKIKTYFNSKYLLVRGYEWFEGNVKEMKKDIDNIIDNYYNTEPIVKQPTTIITSSWRNNMKHTSYEFIDKLLLSIFNNLENVNAFKEYMISILNNTENKYGVLIIPDCENGELVLDILRKLGKYYNRYDNPRNSTERLIRHDGDYSIDVIKENQNCHHVYLGSPNIINIKLSYEKHKIRYTICYIKNEPKLRNEYDHYLSKCEWKSDWLFSMLNDYLEDVDEPVRTSLKEQQCNAMLKWGKQMVTCSCGKEYPLYNKHHHVITKHHLNHIN